MKYTPAMTKLLQLTAVAFLALDVSACAMFEGREKPSQYADDAEISNKLRADLIGDKELSVFQIHVETMQGVVQLTGFVDSAEHESRAVNLAQHVDGVKLVKDNLVVKQ